MTPEPLPETPAPPSSRPWRRPDAALVLIPAGVVAIVVGLGVMTDVDAIGRGLVTVLGVVAVLMGVDRALEWRFGRAVETDLYLSIAWTVIVVGAAIFADLLPLAEARDTSQTIADPSRVRPDLLSDHPFGTDTQALDILGGVIYGARVSLQVSLLAVAVGTIVGGLVGVSAGYFGGRFDAVVGILTDSLLAFPPLILLLAVVTAFEATVLTISLALALLGIPTYTRLARANTIALSQREFVTAARALGAGHARIILRELTPNVIRPLLSYSFIIIAVLIVAEASLSFLGVGISRPTPTWGNMIAAGQLELNETPHLVFIPATVMFVTVFSFNRIGDKARQLWDPRESTL